MLLGAQPPEELVHVAEVARDEEQEVEAPVVEVREVEARAEDAPAGVARVADDRTADHADLDLGVEQREIDRDLRRGQRLAVLGVQVPVVADLEVRRLPAALEVRPAEIGDAGRAELVETRERGLGRAEHRPDEMRAAPRRREHEREEEALRDLDALLLGERRARARLRRLRARRDEPREALGGGVDELLVPDRPAEVVGQRGVDRLGVGAQEAGARGVERRRERSGGCASASLRSGRAGRRPSSSSPRTRCAHVAALAASKASVGHGLARTPGVDLGRREAGCFEERVRLKHRRGGSRRRARRS